MKEYYKGVKAKLDAVGKGFCLAKWTNVTLHLQPGASHSCHHPTEHKISIDEIAKDPSALHNTRQKKEERRKMLSNERPQECKYCWNVEDLGEEHISDRMVYSGFDWSMPHFEEVLSAGHEGNINPRYMEVDFGFECNLKCIYCTPKVSSKWFSEIKKYGNYDVSFSHHHLNDEQLSDKKYTDKSYENPYIKAFWKWWPDLCKDLKVFRITGGEPLINNNTFMILDDFVKNPKPHLELAINSNLSIPQKNFDRFINRLKVILSNNSAKQVHVYTSVEGVGEKAEYQRNGLNFLKFEKNVRRYLKEVQGAKLAFMCTFNLLSASSYIEFLKWYEDIKKGYPDRVSMDINSVNLVDFMGIPIIPHEFHANMKECCEFMENSEHFSYIERNKMRTLYEQTVKSAVPNEVMALRLRDFYSFITEHDRRNRKDFLKTFPEYTNFFTRAKQAFDTV